MRIDMNKSAFALAVAAGLAFAAPPVYSQSKSSNIEKEKTAAGAIAADEHWSQAEMHGDTAYIDQLLLPQYRSVSPTGVAHGKAGIVVGARKNIGNGDGVAKAAAYRKAHPYGTSVVIEGNTAILSFYSPVRGPENGVLSTDVMVYVDGRWHALYSQHAKVD